MLTRYVKAAIRHLLKQPVFSALNILGLPLGLSICLLLLLLVQDHRRADE